MVACFDFQNGSWAIPLQQPVVQACACLVQRCWTKQKLLIRSNKTISLRLHKGQTTYDNTGAFHPKGYLCKIRQIISPRLNLKTARSWWSIRYMVIQIGARKNYLISPFFLFCFLNFSWFRGIHSNQWYQKMLYRLLSKIDRGHTALGLFMKLHVTQVIV